MRHLINFRLFEAEQKDGPVILYLHGLDSNPGDKGEWLASHFSNVIMPHVDYRREGSTIFNQIINLLKGKEVSLIIGNSMGGFLAFWLCRKLNVPGILFNPALHKQSTDVQVDRTASATPTMTVILGKKDTWIDPNITKKWLADNYSGNTEIIMDDLEHRISREEFQKHVLQLVKMDEKSGEILDPKRNQWVEINPKEHPELSKEFFDLISTAYSEIGGHAKIKKPEDVFADKDWNFWSGVDIHGSPDLDLIVFGQKTKYGIKFSGVGHDGQKDTKKVYLEHKAKDLSKIGYYSEVSGKLAQILINKYHINVINDKDEIKKLMPGKDIMFYGKHPTDPDMLGDGWYGRDIGGKEHIKLMVGKPKI
jgi:hypothetical protein